MPHKKSQRHPNESSPIGKSEADKGYTFGLSPDVASIRKEIRSFFASLDENGRKIGKSKWGVYAFYDFDGEPIYVGQTLEGLGSRIGRHLTNQRTDAVAMNVLDPFEVAEICVWPLDLGHLNKKAQQEHLDRAEFTVFEKVIAESKLGAVLNEKPPRSMPVVQLPKAYRKRIVPDEIFPHRKHPDIRIARRANTIASLARVISERKVSRGLRQTLLTQARRLERLAAERLKDFPKDVADNNDE
ncbi:MAG TPA: GIY-YIG nuclease family protein [Verrucomicrobiae bacterium]|nr:GIY-YIG nuclease family protein [Verrucomicrobiae bacterium]